MEQFIQNILIGVRRWVKAKLDEVTYAIANTIANLEQRFSVAEVKLGNIEDFAQVNKIETITVNGVPAEISNKTVNLTIDGSDSGAVTELDDNEDILYLNGTKLGTTLSINFDTSQNKLQLLGVDDAVVSEIDASGFVAAGILAEVTLKTRSTSGSTVTWTPSLDQGVTEPSGWTSANDGQYLIFKWDSSGTYTYTFVPLSSVVGAYTAGTGIEITGNSISLKKATSNTIGGVYVEAAANSGLTLANDGKLSIEGPTPEEVYYFLDNEESGGPA